MTACMKTGAEIGSEAWSRQPLCRCPSCEAHFSAKDRRIFNKDDLGLIYAALRQRATALRSEQAVGEDDHLTGAYERLADKIVTEMASM